MKKILFLAFAFIIANSYSQTITSAQDGDWDLPVTWVGGVVPGASHDVVIAHDNDVDDTRECNSLEIQAGKRLDVQASLTVANTSTMAVGSILNVKTGGTYTQTAGDFTNTQGTLTVFAGRDMVFSNASSTLSNAGTIEVNSSSALFGSIILSGTYSESGAGVINYRRYVASTSTWDLIGPPLSGYDIEDFIDQNTDIASGNGTDGAVGEYAVGVYTNTAAAYSAGNSWQNFTSDSYDSAGNLDPGKGYQMATSGGSEIKFTGNIETGSVSETIVNNEGGTDNQNDGTKWNLVSNPYPSYITVAGFLSVNSSVLHASHQTVWGWGGSSYTAYNSASGANIAPGQGFMVGAVGPNTTSSTLTFTTSMHTTSGSDDFISGDAMENDYRAELFLGMNQNGIYRHTELYFLENMTDGLDPSYDSGILEIANNTIFTRLVDNSLETDFIIQSLAYSEMWDKVIPLGINALGGEEMTVSISHRTTPADLNIYLEDAVEGTMTNLLEEDFVLTPISDLSGAGRFFIHMSADTMSNEDVSTSMLNAYKEVNANYITIEGLATQSNNINVSLYNILGRKVLDTSLNNNMNTQTISTLGMASGIYVIELESGNDRLTKKLIIQ